MMDNQIEVIDLGDQKEEKVYAKRMKVYMVFDKKDADNKQCMYMEKDYLEFDNPYYDHIQIPYNQIKKCVGRINKKMNVWGVFFESKVYLDLDIYVNDQIYKFEIQNKKIVDVIRFFKNLSVEIEDVSGSLKKYIDGRI